MNASSRLWKQLRKGKRYRSEFVAAFVKKLIPLQIRKLLKQHEMSQEILAERSGLTQGVVSRAANLDYGNLTLNTIVRIAGGFDVAFIGAFVPFSEFEHWVNKFSEESLVIDTFEEEDKEQASVNAGEPVHAKTHAERATVSAAGLQSASSTEGIASEQTSSEVSAAAAEAASKLEPFSSLQMDRGALAGAGVAA